MVVFLVLLSIFLVLGLFARRRTAWTRLITVVAILGALLLFYRVG